MSFEAAQEVFPNSCKSKMGLADVEDDVLISKQIQIQAFPGCRTLFDKQEALKRYRDVLIVHGVVSS